MLHVAPLGLVGEHWICGSINMPSLPGLRQQTLTPESGVRQVSEHSLHSSRSLMSEIRPAP